VWCGGVKWVWCVGKWSVVEWSGVIRIAVGEIGMECVLMEEDGEGCSGVGHCGAMSCV